MSDATGNRAVNVLHISSPPDRPRPQSATPDWLIPLLSNPRISLVECPDVYRGLAILGREIDPQIHAVIVCVDVLTPIELEFFDLTSRLHRNVAVYIYGRERSRRRIDEALAHGATAEISRQIVEEFIARTVGLDAEPDVSHTAGETSAPYPANARPSAGADALEPAHPDTVSWPDGAEHDTEHSEPSIPPPIVVTHGADDDVDVDEDLDESEGFDDETPASPARVPWMKYDGAPERSAPERTPPGASKPPDRPGASASRGKLDYEPLLTDEELRALIGDDLTSLGPERAHERTHDDPNRAGGQG